MVVNGRPNVENRGSLKCLVKPEYEEFSAYFIQDRIGGTAGHTNLDFLDTLSAEDLMKNAVVEAAFVYQAAMADERVPRNTLK